MRTGFYHYNITTMNTIRITLYIILTPIAIGLALGLTVALLYYIGYGIFRLFNCSRKAPETPRFKTLVFWGLLGVSGNLVGISINLCKSI